MTGVARHLRSLRSRSTRDELARSLIWLLPVMVLVAVYFGPSHSLSIDRVVAYGLALGVVALAMSRPDLCLLALIVLLPFQGLILAKLWGWGVPVSVAKDLGTWKEALGLAVVFAGARNYIASGRRADAVDRLALAFVGFAALYFFLQPEIVPGAPAATSVRALGFRETAGFVLLMLGARHAPLPPGFARRAAKALLAVGVVVAGAGIYEAVRPDAWNRFVVGTMYYTRYQVAVLGTIPNNMWNILTHGQIGGGQVIRVGSVFLSPLTCGFYLLISFAVGFERTVRRARFTSGLLPTMIIGAGLLLTETRSAIIGALLIAFLAFRPTAGRQRHFRTQVALVLGVLALIAVPAAAASGVLSRFSLLNDSHDVSTQGHVSGFWDGLNVIGSHPLGLGLGTGAGTGQRFQVQGLTIAENNYLEVGDELGVVAMILFVALTLGLIRQLHRFARARDDPLVTAAWAAAAGLAVGAWFLQTWSDFSVSWTFWCLAGAMLGAGARSTVKAAAPVSQPPRAGHSVRWPAGAPAPNGGRAATPGLLPAGSADSA